MAQLRRDYRQFVALDAEVLVVGPDAPAAFQGYWDEKNMPFPGLPDPDHAVADRFLQEVNWLKLGRMPALFVVDKAGRIRYRHYGASMRDIPHNAEVLAVLETLGSSEDAQGISEDAGQDPGVIAAT